MESRAEQAQGYWKKAERYAELASSGQRNITNFVHKRLAERFARMAEDLSAWREAGWPELARSAAVGGLLDIARHAMLAA
jgi:hypothetical protein